MLYQPKLKPFLRFVSRFPCNGMSFVLRAELLTSTVSRFHSDICPDSAGLDISD